MSSDSKPQRMGLGDLAKWVSAIGAVLYLAGFLTVLQHTSRIGLPVVEAAQLRYVWIGFPPVLLLALTGLVASAIWRWLSRKRLGRAIETASARATMATVAASVGAKTGEGSVAPEAGPGGAGALVGSLLGVVLTVAVSLAVAWGGYAFLRWGPVHPLLFVPVSILIWSTALSTFLGMMSTVLQDKDLSSHPTLQGAVIVSPILLVGLVGVLLYAERAYPVLPSHLAGGAPARVRIVLQGKALDQSALRTLGWETEGQGETADPGSAEKSIVTPPLWLKYTSSDLYLVSRDKFPERHRGAAGTRPTAIALRKDFVIALCAEQSE